VGEFLVGGIMALVFAQVAAGQSSAPFLVQTIPVGTKPVGIDQAFTGEITSSSGGTSPDLRVWVPVANSGDDSISVLLLRPVFGAPQGVPYQNVALSAVIRGVPSPYGVIACGLRKPGQFLVTSPSANSVSLIDAPSGAIVQTIRVGPQPYAAACEPGSVVVSNYGDNSLSVVDVFSFTVLKTIPNVAGSRALHGIFVESSTRVWVAGTDANVVTVVDLNSSTVVMRLPIRGPSAVRGVSLPGKYGTEPGVAIASSLDNSIIEINRSTLQTAQIIPNVPTPQDFVTCRPRGLGDFASTGPGNSLAWLSDDKVTLIPGIPGAAGLACWGAPYSTPHSPPSLVLVTSPDSNSVVLIQEQPATPHDFTIANGASFATAPVAPGSLASVFISTAVRQNYYAGAVPLPKSLGGVTLRVGGNLDLSATGIWVYSPTGATEAPLLFVGPNQINFQVPPGSAVSASVPVQLLRTDGSTGLATATFAPTAPGIFTLAMNGRGQAAALNQDNSVNFGTNPASRGSVIQIFATGAGETTPALAAGEAAPASGNPLVLTKVQPTVTIGGKNAKVQFSGMAPGFVGLWQVNAEVPADVMPSIAVPLVITAAGASSNTVTIAVQ
jgi:uncharacterized protein (TIGR03437 family)